MNRSLFFLFCFLLSPILGAAGEKPNIIVIVADDFGVGDIQAHYPGNKIKTPHLDRLVAEGISFTDAHSSSAVCSPTRYGLLTGRYNWRTRLQEWVVAAYEPPLIAEDRPTLPGFLRSNGYDTACIGKWHLGWNWPGPQEAVMTKQKNSQKLLQWDFTKAIPGGPVDRGFGYFFGVDLPNLPPFCYIENDRVVTQPSEPFKLDPSQGIVLPRGFVGCPMSPGWRLDEILPELTKRAVKYIEKNAGNEKPFFLYFPQTSPHEPVSPSEDWKGKSGIAPIADFVMETDWSAGQLIETVNRVGIAEETLIIFTADNGHSHYTGWNELVEAGHLPSGPYRGHKGDIWEGGHRVPLVMRWPRKIAPGSNSDQLICLTDLFATFADVLGEAPPGNGAEDSVSFLEAALGRITKNGKRQNLVSHSNHGEFSYREGPWKIVFRNADKNLEKSRGKPTVPELYNLQEDIAESHNLAEKRMDIVEKMTRGLRAVINQKSNDTRVQFESTQLLRWAPPLSKTE